MLTPTHLIGGQLAYLGAAWWVGHAPHPAEAMVAGLGAVLPDLDQADSGVGRLVPRVSGWIEESVGHRTVTHSLLAAVLVTAAALWLLPSGYAMAFAAGWISHGLLDLLSVGGVAWFWPARARCVLPGDSRHRIEVSGPGEVALAVTLSLLLVPAYALAQLEVGLIGSVRDAMGNIAQARSHYDAHRGDSAWTLRVEGQDNRRFQPVAGEWPVIGAYRSDGLIVRTEDGPRSVCRAEVCDWYARRAVLIEGDAIHTTTTRIRGARVAVQELAGALERLEQVGDVYLTGKVEAPRLPGEEPTVEGTMDGVRLHYASPAKVRSWNPYRQLDHVDLRVQVRAGQPVQLPELELGRDPVQPLEIDERLQRHLPGP